MSAQARKDEIMGYDFELRRVTIDVFLALRGEALRRNPHPKYWSMGRLSAEVMGNHEILKPNSRFRRIDSTSKLMYASRISSIDCLRTPGDECVLDLELDYGSCVGESERISLVCLRRQLHRAGGYLAVLLKQQGEFQEVKVMYLRALAGFEKVPGVDHADTLSTVHNLATLAFSPLYGAFFAQRVWSRPSKRKLLSCFDSNLCL